MALKTISGEASIITVFLSLANSVFSVHHSLLLTWMWFMTD